MHQLPHIYLASKSPRRKHLLEAAHIPFEILEVDIEETYPADTPIDYVAEYLAIKKGKGALEVQPNGIILAADSIVIQDGEIFEKPKDREDAIRIIKTIEGSVHNVITGVCIISKGSIVHFSDRSEVHLARMSTEEIEWYIDTFEPYDKAGAYGIQDWIGHCKIDRIIGSYNNIMGLPTHRVYKELQSFRT